MPVSFARLRIAGFKSFAEPATVEILPGLTGVVGPNGCGKSNVVEALRWAMGENSARSLRGGEMDDVIFAGTANRASRNIAEVVLTMEEAAGFAPPPFHEQGDLQISRQIERGNGSTYRVNGKEVRARDVQTLFADLASGARSSAMVSQGRVGAIVNARPEERRSILEEAAGITGLHARRHEAELKLRQAEANMERAEDLRAQLENQLGDLKRQARQANRYRNISGAVRDADAELMSIQRARVETARAAARAALALAQEAVTKAAQAVAEQTQQAGGSADALPPLREAEGEARTALERHRLAQEQIAAEENRAKQALSAARDRLAQIARDLTHAEQVQRDAAAAVDRLTGEDGKLAEAEQAHPAQAEAAEAAATEAAEAVRVAEAEANRATEQAAELNAKSQALGQMLAQAEQRLRRAAEQVGKLEEEHRRVSAQLVDPARLQQAEAEQATAETELTALRAAVEAAEQARAAALAASATARDALNKAEAARTKLAAEAQALAEVLAVKDGEKWPPMVDSLDVPAGLEQALGAALGEELAAAADPAAARHWRELPPLPAAPLPAGATSLADTVKAPPILARALSHIGLMADGEAAAAAQPHLAPGQMLVTAEGAIWRWDGYAIRAGTPTAAAVRLTQRNRLRGLRARLAEAEAAAQSARAARTEAEAGEKSAVAAEQQARTARREGEQRLERARSAAGTLRAQAATATARLAGLEEQLARATPEKSEAEQAVAQAQAARAGLPDLSALRADVDRARAALTAARTREAGARSNRDSLARDATSRTNRRRAIASEREDWAMRAKDGGGRVTDLSARRRAAEEEHAALEAAPAAIAARRGAAQAELQEAEATHRRAAQALKEAEQAAGATDRAARAAEAALAAAREGAVRAESAAEQADHAWGTVAERILERLGANPTLPDAPPGATQETEDKARRKLERLQREREEMGPVNLRAEIEAEEVEKRAAAITTEKEELATAIAKLRGSIGHLNREGRERLTTVFKQVDAHFQQLFAGVFGGGRAHLAMVGSDDPLTAGLEIFAQPPGKKLATLSLLSGGEQALTALSLIFAVFRCNPAPICVLDEVDAPLDDANVDRFCGLLADMVKETGTRFLVVTHHHVTMARMDRLYGVTMQERGISRLLSVDLQQASRMVEPERMAAE